MTNTDTAHDDVRERKPVAWRYEYSVQYRNKMECTKNLAPLSILSEHRWSPEEARNYSETPLYTALATTTQPDNELADAADSEPSGLSNTMRQLGKTVSVSLQPSDLGFTGELWTVSTYTTGHIGQGYTLEEALAAYAVDSRAQGEAQ